MNKKSLLHTIATHGYNVGFGAKKNFASHDIIVKLPSWIGFLTLTIGILQLGYPAIGANKEISIALIIVSIASIYISIYNSNTDKYEKEGIRLTKIFNQLRNLYNIVKDKNSNDFESEEKRLNEIMEDFYSNTVTKQVFLSQWSAHLKFFYEMQIDWIDEQLNFKFFKDKFPGSLKWALILILLLSITIYYAKSRGFC